MTPDLDSIFAAPRLHLVVWDRHDRTDHAAALQLPEQIASHPRLGALVLPMLRPSGRDQPGRQAIEQAASEWFGARGAWTCELWLQTPASAESELWSLLRTTAISSSIGIARALFYKDRARWEPLGDSATARYVVACAPLAGTAEEVAYSSLPVGRRAAVLKGIWWRGSSKLLCACVSQCGPRNIDPHAERQDLASILAQMLAPIGPNAFGSALPGQEVDPSRFGVSHLVCFALNAFTTDDLDQAYGDRRATRPHCCATIDDYLAGIRTGSWP